MLSEFLNIIFRSIKLDKSLYADNKNFGDASIYYAIIIIIIMSIVGMVPGSVLYKHLGNMFVSEGPTLRRIIIMSFAVWIIKTAYLYFVGVVLFPSKSTKSSFRKILITVSYAHAPLIFNALIIDYRLLYLMFIPYIWYNIALIIGINELLKYKNYLKSTLIVTAPIILLLIFTIMQLSNFQIGVVS